MIVSGKTCKFVITFWYLPNYLKIVTKLSAKLMLEYKSWINITKSLHQFIHEPNNLALNIRIIQTTKSGYSSNSLEIYGPTQIYSYI